MNKYYKLLLIRGNVSSDKPGKAANYDAKKIQIVISDPATLPEITTARSTGRLLVNAICAQEIRQSLMARM